MCLHPKAWLLLNTKFQLYILRCFHWLTYSNDDHIPRANSPIKHRLISSLFEIIGSVSCSIRIFGTIRRQNISKWCFANIFFTTWNSSAYWYIAAVAGNVTSDNILLFMSWFSLIIRLCHAWHACLDTFRNMWHRERHLGTLYGVIEFDKKCNDLLLYDMTPSPDAINAKLNWLMYIDA